MNYAKMFFNRDSEKKYALEHLSNEDYDKRYEELMKHMEKAYKELLNKWVMEGVITQNECDQAEAEYGARIFDSDAFDAILGEA